MSGDGLLTALQVAALIQASGGSLADWLDGSFQPYPQKLVNVTVPDRARRTGWQGCEPLAAAVAAAETAMAGSGRVLVRASGTEPLLRVMVEAAEAADVEHWSSHLAQLADQHLNAV
jgi:phosphoglucosamine mutase